MLGKITPWIILTLLLTSMILTFLTVEAAENLPTVWVKVRRIQAIDPIEGFLQDGADWRYKIWVSDGETATTKEFKCPSDDDDIVIDHVDSFSDLKHKDVYITIMLYEDDPFGAYETADISSTGNYFDCTYDLKTNDFDGDETIFESDYYKTSGDYDGSVTTDENDANLWFSIWDNYKAPFADADIDKECLPGEKVNFDGSGSTASTGSSIVRYEWDFENDGIVDAEGEKTSYTYQLKGVHTCRLRVTDSIGEWDEDHVLVNVINRPPTAEFTYSPTNPTIQDVVNFVDTSSDQDGSITSWYWKFGDGNSSTLQSPTHQYEDKGTYIVKLTVTDDSGVSATNQKSVKIWNTLPVAQFSFSPSDPIATEEVQFTDESYDLEGRSFTYLWDFGDGYTSDVSNPKHSFANPSEYNVNLTVWDDENWAASVIKSIVVIQNLPPTADFSFNPIDPSVDDTISFIDLSEDPENKGLTCLWDFGDDSNSSTHNPTHKYVAAGQYTINLTVWDEGGLSATATKTVDILPPSFIGTPLFYVLIAIIGICVVIGGSFVLVRKRRGQNLPVNTA